MATIELEESEKIYKDYGEHLLWTGGYNFLFAGKVPQSLLPHAKQKILEALKLLEIYSINKKDDKQLQTLQEVMSNLTTYIDDEEAIRAASERFGNPDWRKHFIPALQKIQDDTQEIRT